MTESKTRPLSLRVRTDVLDALEAAGIAPVDVARAALEREAARAKRMAAVARLRKSAKGFKLGFDAAELIRKDRDSGHD